jgi:hypothetical protein
MKFETKEDVKEYLNHNELECLLCGKRYVFLGNHLIQAHKISCEDYRIMFNLPIKTPLAGLGYREKHRKVMKDLFDDGRLSIPDDINFLKKISYLGAVAKSIHSGATKRIYFYKRKKETLDEKRISAVAAANMGDNSLLLKYKKEIERRKEQRQAVWLALGRKTTKEAAKIAGLTRRTADRYAKIIGVTFYQKFNRMGWTDEQIKTMRSLYEDAMKQWGRIPNKSNIPD